MSDKAKKEMAEYCKGVTARYKPGALCESPGCSGKASSHHPAFVAARLRLIDDAKKEHEEYHEKHPEHAADCWLLDLTSEVGKLLCPCCLARIQGILHAEGIVPDLGALAIAPVMALTESASVSPEECKRDTIRYMKSLLLRQNPDAAGAIAIDTKKLKDILEKEGRDGLKRYLAEQISSTIANDIADTLSKDKPLKDGEVGTPITDAELKQIRRTLINDVDTLPLDIRGIIGRGDN